MPFVVRIELTATVGVFIPKLVPSNIKSDVLVKAVPAPFQ